jgi:hypothetical protein
VITRREAALRTLAIAGLCGLALVALVALPYALGQGPQVAALEGAAIAGALALARALGTASAAAGRTVWRATIALGVVASVGWLGPRAVAVPGLAEHVGHWTTPIGITGAGIAIALIVLGVAALGRADGLRAAAAALAVGAVLAPVVATSVAALGPRPANAADLLAGVSSAHPAHPGHGHAARGSARVVTGIRPGFGGHTGHYVYANATRPHLPPWALALALGAAATAVLNGAGALRRRTATDPPGGMDALTRSRRAALYR